MLVLTRRPDESIAIGNNVAVQVLNVSRGRVRLGILAPGSILIRRSELGLSDGDDRRSGVAALSAAATR